MLFNVRHGKEVRLHAMNPESRVLGDIITNANGLGAFAPLKL